MNKKKELLFNVRCVFMLFMFFISLSLYAQQNDLEEVVVKKLVNPELFESDIFNLHLPPGMEYRKVPGIYLHLQSDSDEHELWPHLDPSLMPFLMGITVVQESKPKNFEALVDSHSKIYLKNSNYTMVDSPYVTDVMLNDGVQAKFINQRFLKTDFKKEEQVMWVGKLIVPNSTGKIWILTAYIKCSRAGWKGVSYERIPWFLASHLKSFSYNRTGIVLAQKKLKKVYENFNWNIKQSVRKAMEGKRLAKARKIDESIEHFREALKLSVYQTFSLHALPWLLMDSENDDLEEAEGFAHKSLELSDGFSLEALVTLAKVKEKKGEIQAAIGLLDRALALNPKDKKTLTTHRQALMKKQGLK